MYISLKQMNYFLGPCDFLQHWVYPLSQESWFLHSPRGTLHSLEAGTILIQLRILDILRDETMEGKLHILFREKGDVDLFITSVPLNLQFYFVGKNIDFVWLVLQ